MKATGNRQQATGKNVRRILVALILLVEFASPCGLMARAEVTDRMLAIVNGQLITESDVRWALALDSELEPLNLSRENRQTMLERLIDQKLLDQEAEKTPQNEPSEDEITKYIKTNLIDKFASEQIFRNRLLKVGLDQASLREIVRHRLEISKYMDFRFRSFVFVKPEEVERYYHEVQVPRQKSSGTPVEALNDKLRGKIEGILEDQKFNSELERFFDEARAQAQVIRLAQS